MRGDRRHRRHGGWTNVIDVGEVVLRRWTQWFWLRIGGEGLQPPTTATTVKIQETGDHIVTDGPFAETKEQLGGYYLLDCKDLDDALAWAKRIPWPGGSVEVRPVMDYEAAGSQVHTNRAEAEAAR